MASIFLSYRRDDSPGHAGRLYDRLVTKFGAENVFRDVETIDPGLDFGEVVEKALQTCGVVLVLIGRAWLSNTDAKGRRRLDIDDDWVRIEVGTALTRGIRVIPVLVEDAVMPSAEELPPALGKLARRNAIELSDGRWNYDCNVLMDAIERALGGAKPAAAEPKPSLASPALPAPATSHPGPAQFPALSPELRPFAPEELLGLWQVEIRSMIPTLMRIAFAPDGSCAGSQQIFGMDVAFAGNWTFNVHTRVIQVTAMAMMQVTQFAVQVSNRTPDGFAGTDGQNGYVFHRASG